MITHEFDPQVNLKLIAIVGLGGTGSQLARSVARMLYDMRRRSMQTPQLLFIDPDVVEEKNVGRQMFTPADVGKPKAEVLARRFNFALGLDITARCDPLSRDWFARGEFGEHHLLLCEAVDNHTARAELAAIDATWIDAGNHFSSGQVVIGNTSKPDAVRAALEMALKPNSRLTGKLTSCPNAALVFPELLKPEEKPAAAQISCADLVALGEQHLLINDAVATVAAQYVFKLLFRQPIKTYKTTIDIDTLAMRSVLITSEEMEQFYAVGQP